MHKFVLIDPNIYLVIYVNRLISQSCNKKGLVYITIYNLQQKETSIYIFVFSDKNN